MAALILTGTIDSNAFGNTSTVVSDLKERKKQYYDVLEKYIKITDIDKLIFAENSGAEFDVDYFDSLSKDYNKKFEYLYLPSDVSKTLTYGKSYGEAKLISDAVKTSVLLKNESYFYKVTGRVFVSNLNVFFKDNVSTRFIAYNHAKWLLTVFFKIDKRIYCENLLNAENLCDEKEGKPIELIYWEQLKENYDVKCFRRYPRLEGVIGGSGKQYNRSIVNRIMRQILIWIGFFDLDTKQRWYHRILYKRYMGN